MSQPILLAEDEESDAIFMQLALAEASVGNPVQVVKDGQQAMDYLAGTGRYADRAAYPLPKLLLLDLKLPRVLGLDVLRWIRERSPVPQLPVIVCSGSDQDSDVETAYALGAQGYIIKPGRPAELEQIARLIKKYFLERNGPPADCKEWQAVNVPRPVARER